jgi:hydrogenase-4 component F
MIWVYYLPVALSGVGGLLCLIPKTRLEEDVSIIASFATLAASLLIAFFPDARISGLYVDGFSKLMQIMISAVYVLTVLYSINYLDHIENKLFQTNLYFLLLNWFVVSMFFTVMVDNVGLLWVGVEATTVTSALLIATDNNEVAVEATWRYIVIVSTGLTISLLATIFIYGGFHTLSLNALLQAPQATKIVSVGALLGIIGYGTKGGIFPMHTWLPDAHGRAPAPISAMFSAILLPVALYTIVRFVQFVPLASVKNFAVVLGALSVILASLMTFSQREYKRMFVYSSIENMGMALIGIALGGSAFIGSLIIILTHAFAKSSAFFLTGNVLKGYGTPVIREVKGVSKRMPLTGYSLFFAALAVTGAPPFGTFFGELLIMAAMIKVYGVWFAVLIGVFLVIAFIGVNYRVVRMVFSEPDEQKRHFEDKAAIPVIGLISALSIIFLTPVIYYLVKGVVVR